MHELASFFRGRTPASAIKRNARLVLAPRSSLLSDAAPVRRSPDDRRYTYGLMRVFHAVTTRRREIRRSIPFEEPRALLVAPCSGGNKSYGARSDFSLSLSGSRLSPPRDDFLRENYLSAPDELRLTDR